MKTMKLTTAYIIGFVFGGGLMFVNGLFGFFPMTKISLIIQTGIVISAWICILTALLWKKEKGDEMSEKHLHKSFFYGGLLFMFVLVWLDLLDNCKKIVIVDNFQLITLAGGCAALVIGLYFLYQEKRG